jgi:hypothetical protein
MSRGVAQKAPHQGVRFDPGNRRSGSPGWRLIGLGGVQPNWWGRDGDQLVRDCQILVILDLKTWLVVPTSQDGDRPVQPLRG